MVSVKNLSRSLRREWTAENLNPGGPAFYPTNDVQDPLIPPSEEKRTIPSYGLKSPGKAIVVLGILLLMPVILHITGRLVPTRNHTRFTEFLKNPMIDRSILRKKIQQTKIMDWRIRQLKPDGIHLLLDTTSNTLFIKKGSRIIHRAVVSCGSGSVLNDPDGKRRWVFDTPRGRFTINSKLKNPVWVKPDWAFIEEGENIPKESTARLEAGVLGEYALGFGDGYFIHGTLYSRMLGKNVTHGCIRMGDDDLKILFRSVSVGCKLFIY
jgi:L,D-transpeptidase ErfK/SrfK